MRVETIDSDLFGVQYARRIARLPWLPIGLSRSPGFIHHFAIHGIGSVSGVPPLAVEREGDGITGRAAPTDVHEWQTEIEIAIVGIDRVKAAERKRTGGRTIGKSRWSLDVGGAGSGSLRQRQ